MLGGSALGASLELGGYSQAEADFVPGLGLGGALLSVLRSGDHFAVSFPASLSFKANAVSDPHHLGTSGVLADQSLANFELAGARLGPAVHAVNFQAQLLVSIAPQGRFVTELAVPGSIQLASGTNSGAGGFTKSITPRTALTAILFFNAASWPSTNLYPTPGIYPIDVDDLLKQTDHTLTATESPTGATANLTNKAYSATVSFAGNVSRSVLHALLAALSFIGGMARRFPYRLTGLLSVSGLAAKRLGRSLSGVASFAGAVAKTVKRPVSGSLSFVGNRVRVLGKTLGSTLTPTGRITRATVHTLQSVLRFTVAFIGGNKQVLLSSALNFAGNTRRATARSLSAASDFTGTLPRRFSTVLSGALSASGALARKSLLALRGALSFTGAVVRLSLVQLLAGLVLTGRTTRAIVHILLAALTSGASVVKRTAHTLVASSSFVGAITRAITLVLQSVLTLTGVIRRAIAHVLFAVLTLTGATAKRTIRTLVGASLSLSGLFLRGKDFRATLFLTVLFKRPFHQLLNFWLRVRSTVTPLSNRAVNLVLFRSPRTDETPDDSDLFTYDVLEQNVGSTDLVAESTLRLQDLKRHGTVIVGPPLLTTVSEDDEDRLTLTYSSAPDIPA